MSTSPAQDQDQTWLCFFQLSQAKAQPNMSKERDRSRSPHRIESQNVEGDESGYETAHEDTPLPDGTVETITRTSHYKIAKILYWIQHTADPLAVTDVTFERVFSSLHTYIKELQQELTYYREHISIGHRVPAYIRHLPESRDIHAQYLNSKAEQFKRDSQPLLPGENPLIGATLPDPSKLAWCPECKKHLWRSDFAVPDGKSSCTTCAAKTKHPIPAKPQNPSQSLAKRAKTHLPASHQSQTSDATNSDSLPAVWTHPETRPIVTSSHFSIAKILYALEHEPRLTEVHEITAHNSADCLRNYLSDFFRELAFRQRHMMERKQGLSDYEVLIQNSVRTRHGHASYLNSKVRSLFVVDPGHCTNTVLGNISRSASGEAQQVGASTKTKKPPLEEEVKFCPQCQTEHPVSDFPAQPPNRVCFECTLQPPPHNQLTHELNMAEMEAVTIAGDHSMQKSNNTVIKELFDTIEDPEFFPQVSAEIVTKALVISVRFIQNKKGETDIQRKRDSERYRPTPWCQKLQVAREVGMTTQSQMRLMTQRIRSTPAAV